MPNKNLNIFSEEVQDIIEQKPNWLIRNSIISIFTVLIIVIVISIMIKYPETTIINDFKLESIVPSYQFVAQSNGNLKLLIKNNSIVNKGDWIAFIENSISLNDFLNAEKYLKEIEPYITTDDINNIPINKHFNLGDLEIFYSTFFKNLEILKTHLKVNPESFKIQAFNNEILGQKNILQSKQKELKKIQEIILIQKSKLNANRELYEKGYLSKIEFENTLKEFNEIERNYLNLITTIKLHESNIVQIKDQATQSNVDNSLKLADMKRNCVNSYFIFKEEFSNWKDNHVFIAPYNGKVDFIKVWNSDHFVFTGDHLMSLKSTKLGIIGRGIINGKNIGKVHKDQKVIIKLDGYINSEYGFLEGKVRNVSIHPNKEGFYIVNISLPNDLKTSYGIAIPFQPELSGFGEIILKDQSLFELFIKNIIKFLDNDNT